MEKIKYIVLCVGNEGQQIQNQNHLQIRLYELKKIAKSQILKKYIESQRTQNPSSEGRPISLISAHPRNYLFDVMLQKDLEFLPNGREIVERSTEVKVQLPIRLEIVHSHSSSQFLTSNISSGISLDHFTLLHKIGEGTFAEVFLAELKHDKSLHTLKRIHKAAHQQKSTKEALLSEFQSLKYRSRHKVNLSFMFETPFDVYFVTDFCVYGDLYKVIQRQKQKQFQCKECCKFTRAQKYTVWIQVVLAMVHLHQKGYIYRDLKPENILFDWDGTVRLCDFGACKKINKGEQLTEICGTIEYIAPQMIEKQGYGKAIDLYALGVLLYELLAEKTPFDNINMENLKTTKFKGIKFNPEIFAPQQIEIIDHLTKITPSQRLGYENSIDIFKHSFFNQPQTRRIVEGIVKGQINKELVSKLTPEIECSLPESNDRSKISYGQYFEKGYNYLEPKCTIDQKMGPKFNSGF